MRKMKKFARGGSTDRAKARMDRRMADIEKDYRKALAKGKSDKEAKAKRDQRIADAKDDYAKRTGADRTETRAAEKAAEAKLKATRRSPDKNTQPVSALKEGSRSLMTKVDMPKVETPKVGAPSGKQTFSQAFAAARKDGAKTFTWNGKSYTTEMRGGKASPPPTRVGTGTPRTADFDAGALRKLEAEVTRRGVRAPKEEPKSAGRQMAERSAQRQQGQIDELGRDFGRAGNAVARFFAGKNRDKMKGYAKGGKIDGIAIRGKTKLKRKK